MAFRPIGFFVSSLRMSLISLQLTLYVAGDTPRSRQAVANLQRMCAELLGGRAECATVDVTADPEIAERERILTTPTVIRENPPPRRRVTGDLSDLTRVIAALDLESATSTPELQ